MATEFLGNYLLPELIKKSHEIIILKHSFSNVWRIKNYLLQIRSYDIDKIDIEKVFQANKIDVIIHLATIKTAWFFRYPSQNCRRIKKYR